MNFQEYKEKIIIKTQDGINGKIKFRMYYQPHCGKSWEKGWIGEKSFTPEELVSENDPHGVLEPYKAVWSMLDEQIHNYYMKKIVK